MELEHMQNLLTIEVYRRAFLGRGQLISRGHDWMIIAER